MRRNKQARLARVGLGARARRGLAQLLAQARHGLGLAAHAQERALAVAALLVGGLSTSAGARAV